MNNTDQTTEGRRDAALALKEAIERESYDFHLLYVDCQLNDFENWETERSMIKAEGAIEALEGLAADTGVSERVRGAEDEGKTRLGAYMADLLENGRGYISALTRSMEEAEGDVKLANELRSRRGSLEEDLAIAEDVLAYLAGEDIQRG